jgi:hypothetical protein
MMAIEAMLPNKPFAIDASRRIGEIPHNRSAWGEDRFCARPLELSRAGAGARAFICGRLRAGW